jgi:ABC-type Mn2+/Zn2+ transport system permease subunit
MLFLAAAIAVLAGVSGLYASYYAGTAAGASIALAIVVAYLLSLPAGRLPALRARARSRPEATIA